MISTFRRESQTTSSVTWEEVIGKSNLPEKIPPPLSISRGSNFTDVNESEPFPKWRILVQRASTSTNLLLPKHSCGCDIQPQINRFVQHCKGLMKGCRTIQKGAAFSFALNSPWNGQESESCLQKIMIQTKFVVFPPRIKLDAQLQRGL